jgi:hypothetical protein
MTIKGKNNKVGDGPRTSIRKEKTPRFGDSKNIAIEKAHDDPWFLVASSRFGLSFAFGVSPCIFLRCSSQVFCRVVQE